MGKDKPSDPKRSSNPTDDDKDAAADAREEAMRRVMDQEKKGARDN